MINTLPHNQHRWGCRPVHLMRNWDRSNISSLIKQALSLAIIWVLNIWWLENRPMGMTHRSHYCLKGSQMSISMINSSSGPSHHHPHSLEQIFSICSYPLDCVTVWLSRKTVVEGTPTTLLLPTNWPSSTWPNAAGGSTLVSTPKTKFASRPLKDSSNIVCCIQSSLIVIVNACQSSYREKAGCSCIAKEQITSCWVEWSHQAKKEE